MSTTAVERSTRSKSNTSADRFSDEERAAMRERAQELKGSRRRATTQDGEQELLAKIAEMPETDRSIATRLHEIVTANSSSLVPRTWYGMPAYAKDGDVVCFFQSSHKFKTRYVTLGFSDKARFDDGGMWPTSFALCELSPTEEAQITALLKKAVS